MGQDLISTECEIKMLYGLHQYRSRLLEEEHFSDTVLCSGLSVFGFPRSPLKITYHLRKEDGKRSKILSFEQPLPSVEE